MNIKIKHIIVSCLGALMLAFSAGKAQAQEDYRFDIGGGVGMTGYLGDANTSNLLSHPGWDIQALLRYMVNPRFAFKTNLYVGGLSGNSADMTNVFPEEKTFKFNSTFYEVGELFEFNFFNYGMGERYRKLKRCSPYITAGLSLLAWSADGKAGFTVAIPMGLGVKYKLSRRVNLGFEFLMKKTLSDKLDGEAGADPYGIKHAFMKNTDWLSTMTFTISYEFSERCRACNYKE
ncbi:MAG: porin family protein [Prevotella sp.]|nr:porin family protein [Prevotella sp.]MCM1074248.1 porin family protein [Ruminococcus sp.]